MEKIRINSGNISEVKNALNGFLLISIKRKKANTIGKPEILIVIAKINKIPDMYLLKLYKKIPDNISNGAWVSPCVAIKLSIDTIKKIIKVEIK